MERGVDRIAAEELTVPPGGDELFSLLVLKGHVESGEWDAIIVDCAPTGETLRLLSFPDAARWWLDKVLGKEQSMLSAARRSRACSSTSSCPTRRSWPRSSGSSATSSRCTSCCATPRAYRCGW